MMTISQTNHLLRWLSSLALLLAACRSFDEPALIYDPNAPSAAAPAISSVDPAEAAFAGYTEVRLTGNNFAARMQDNAVYFGTQPGQITSASANEITVIPPNMVAENLSIKVVVAGALEIAQFSPYSLKAVVAEYGDFTDLENVFALAVDLNENLYAHYRVIGASRSYVAKITPQGEKDDDYGTTSAFPQAREMRIGPGGELYLQRSLGNLFKIGASGGEAQLFATFPATVTFDFDENGNIFAAGNRSGVFAVSPAGVPTNTGRFSVYDVRSLRVFEGAVQVAALYMGTDASIPRAGIWRAPITSATGTLGNEELVFDWATSGEFAAAQFFALTFAQDREIYAGTNNINPILRLKPDGSSAALYSGLLGADATHIVWGNGDYLYMNRGNRVASNRRVYRIDMGKKGAPYYGRR